MSNICWWVLANTALHVTPNVFEKGTEELVDQADASGVENCSSVRCCVVVLQNAEINTAESSFEERHQMSLQEIPISLTIDVSLQKDARSVWQFAVIPTTHTI